MCAVACYMLTLFYILICGPPPCSFELGAGAPEYDSHEMPREEDVFGGIAQCDSPRHRCHTRGTSTKKRAEICVLDFVDDKGPLDESGEGVQERRQILVCSPTMLSVSGFDVRFRNIAVRVKVLREILDSLTKGFYSASLFTVSSFSKWPIGSGLRRKRSSEASSYQLVNTVYPLGSCSNRHMGLLRLSSLRRLPLLRLLLLL